MEQTRQNPPISLEEQPRKKEGSVLTLLMSDHLGVTGKLMSGTQETELFKNIAKANHGYSTGFGDGTMHIFFGADLSNSADDALNAARLFFQIIDGVDEGLKKMGQDPSDSKIGIDFGKIEIDKDGAVSSPNQDVSDLIAQGAKPGSLLITQRVYEKLTKKIKVYKGLAFKENDQVVQAYNVREV